MTKLGKLTRLKSAMKRWPSIPKLSRSQSSISAGAANDIEGNDKVPEGLHVVYVGRDRRRFLVTAAVVNHPLFRELVMEKPGDDHLQPDCEDGVVVACEVVLFKHLLWMLENTGGQLESTEELVQYYT